MKTVLYKTDQSPPARAVKMLVYLLGLDIEQRDLNPVLREQDAPEFRKGPTYMGQMTEMPKEVVSGIKNAFSIMEAYLSETTYLADDTMTVADICAYATVSSLDGLVPVDEKKYPKLKQWLNTMYEKDFSKKMNEPGCRDHVTYLKLLMEHNKHNQKSKL